MNLVCIDIGNTNVVIGYYHKNQLIEKSILIRDNSYNLEDLIISFKDLKSRVNIVYSLEFASSLHSKKSQLKNIVIIP